MLFCCHRINTVSELLCIDHRHGIEIDLRDNERDIYLAHDPFSTGVLLDTFLQHYNHKFIILNIKCENIEYRALELLEKYSITNYFFLDSSFPMIRKISDQGNRNFAIRFSEYEGLDTLQNMKGKVDWVWVDCFTRNPLTPAIYNQIKEWNYKICFVSPELQMQQNKIEEYRDYFNENKMQLDMVCTKYYNVNKWLANNVQIVIPMSGLGQRFVDAGYKEPKPLIIVDNKPIIEHVVNLFPEESDLTFICNSKHLQETNMRNVLTNISKKSRIFEVPVEGREGPVHAVSLIFDHIDDNKEVIVSYCDYGTYWNYFDFLLDTRSRNANGAIACYRGFHPHMLGNDNYAYLKESKIPTVGNKVPLKETELGSTWMESIQEKKPYTNDKMSEYASNGTYYFKSGKIMKTYFKQLMDSKHKINNEYYVSMVYNFMDRVSIYEIENMLQWGTPNDLKIYNDWSNYFTNIVKPREYAKDKYDVTLILPMAGAGSRFSVKGYKTPKPLLDVCGLPMIVQAVKCLPDTSNKVFISLTSEIKDILESSFKNTSIITIDSVTQGQACTCEIGIKDDILNKPILISACDNGVVYDDNKYQLLLQDKTIDVIVWTFRNKPTSTNNPNMYAWVTTDEDNNILSVSCKKFDNKIHSLINSHVIIGTMFFRKAYYFMDGLKQNYAEHITTNGEYYVDDVINQNIKHGLKVKAFEVSDYICWGTPDDYETYLYWQKYFDKCADHVYSIDKDITKGIKVPLI